MISAATGDTLNETICVKNQTGHFYLFCMKIFLADSIELSLIECAFIPKTVSFFVKQRLEMTSENHLNLMGIVFAVIESKQLQ